jgi:membrane-associated phospholipid phosphatase
LLNFLKRQCANPLIIVLALYQLVMLTLLVIFFPRVTNNYFWLAVNIITLIYILWNKPGFVNNSKRFSVIVIITINFSQLHYLVHTIHPTDFDSILINIDHHFFGVHPTIWMERFTFPALTEILQIVYSTFYFLPIFLGIILYKKGNTEEFDFLVFLIIFGFYLSYIGYFLVPAIGPRFTLDNLQNFPLKGVWITERIQILLNTLENTQRDAFPSGHTALTLVTLYLARKYHQKYFMFMIPVTVMMIFSTVYLRYHYVIDVVAGFVLFFVIIKTGTLLYYKLKNIQK